MADMTIEDVKKAKIKLESDILKMIKDFESDTGVYINYLNMDRKYDEDDQVENVPSRRRVGKLQNVEASMELDLMY